jgi:hypothetical protein
MCGKVKMQVSSVASGLYFTRLVSGAKTITKSAANEIEFMDRKRVSASFADSWLTAYYTLFISNFHSELNANDLS